MKRSNKNFIMILLIVVLSLLTYFTMNYIKNNNDIDNDLKFENSNQQPSMPPNGMQEKSESNSDDIEDNNQMSEPPEKPDGDSNEPPSDNMQLNDKNMISNKLNSTYYIVFGVESLLLTSLLVYSVMSNFNKKTLKKTLCSFDKTMIFGLLVIILTVILTVLDVYITNNYFLNNTLKNTMNNPMNNESSNVEASANTVIDGTDKTLTDSYTTANEDESVILVKNSGNLTLNNATITKSGGNSSNTENSEFYGINAGILVTKNSTATIKNSTITTNAKGSNAVFSTGTDSKIYISDSTIITKGESSARGLDATYGGYIEADNVNIKTQGNSCATLATDRGEGTVIANNSTLETNGTGSPVIYSTGNISINNTKGTANNSQLVVIEGKNSATVKNSTLYASGTGNRGTTDQSGVMIYQSMSGDAAEGTGNFESIDSTLTILSNSDYYKTAPMFFITNTDAKISLTNTKLVYGSNILISIKGTSEWGNSGSNGGNLTFNATKQSLTGNIEVDNISTLTMNLTNSSYKGTINSSNSAKSIKLVLDEDSTITLTGNSYITSIEDDDSTYSNINFNGYKLYVNGKSIN